MTQQTLHQLFAIIRYLENPDNSGLAFDETLVYLEKGRDETYVTVNENKVLRIQFNVGTGARTCDYVQVFVDRGNQYHQYIRNLIGEIYSRIPGAFPRKKPSFSSLVIAHVKALLKGV